MPSPPKQLTVLERHFQKIIIAVIIIIISSSSSSSTIIEINVCSLLYVGSKCSFQRLILPTRPHGAITQKTTICISIIIIIIIIIISSGGSSSSSSSSSSGNYYANKVETEHLVPVNSSGTNYIYEWKQRK
jgi:hypothetical protein